MPRKPIVRSNEHFYHITARSNNKEFFYLPTIEIWELMTEKIGKLQSLYQIKISAFVLMNNHFHLLVQTPEHEIDRVMYFFMKGITLDIQKNTGRVNKIFGGRYKGSIITNYAYLINVYKYIYRNPIASGVVDKAELYPFSTLFYKNSKNLNLPFRLDTIMESDVFESYDDLDEVKWINQKYEDEEAESIKCGLKKSTFSYRKDKINNKFIEPIIRHPGK